MPIATPKQYAAMLDAVIAGEGDRAEALGKRHVLRAAEIYVGRLQLRQDEMQEDKQRRLIQR